jgi:ribose transport system substrate-binding protein
MKSLVAWRRSALIGLVALALALTAACQSSSNSPSNSAAATNSAASTGSASAGVAQAMADTKTAEDPPAFTAPGPAFDPSAAKGKTLWVIDVASSIPLTQVTDAAAQEALGLVGAKVVRFDGKGSASEFARGVNQAIADHADAIALFAIDPNVVAGPVQKAISAGIPVIALQYGDADVALPLGVKAQVTYCYTCAGEIMANWIVSDTQGKGADVELITSTDVSNSKPLIAGFTAKLKAGCPDCKINTDNVPVANWQTDVGTTVKSALVSNPNIKYVVPIYDGMALFATPAIQTSGKSDVKVVTFNGTLGNMQNLAAGKIVAAEVGSPQAWEGWGLADQFLRILAGQPAAKDENIGLRIFDKTNIASIDLKKPERDWYGVDFASGYKKIWGLS